MEKKVAFFSDGLRIDGVLFGPDDPAGPPRPGIVMCQGAVGRKEFFGFPQIARRFVDLGYVALIFDYRGFGESEGQRGRVFPLEHIEDVRNAITFLQIQPGVDRDSIALFGTSMGGAYVAYAGGVDQRARWVVSVVGYGDGEGTMRGRRNDEEWAAFLNRLAEDREQRVLTGKSQLVQRSETTPQNSADMTVRARVIGAPELGDTRVPDQTVESVEHRLEFKPVDMVHRISPRAVLFIAAENDMLTTAGGIEAMYERAQEPKRYECLVGIGHYEIYEEPHVSRMIELTDSWIRANRTAGVASSR